MSNMISPEPRAVQTQPGPTKRSVSRRSAVASLVGAAGGIGAWKTLGGASRAQAVCPPIPDWAGSLQEEQLNNTNRGLVFDPDRGMVVTFGNSIFQLDAVTGLFTLCRNGSEVLRGTGTVDIQKRKIVVVEDIEAPGATTGTRTLRLSHVIQVIDRTPYRVQVDTEAGLLGQAPTFWFSTVYDFSVGAFTSGFIVKGTAPVFDLSAFGPLNQIIGGKLGTIVFPPPNMSSDTIVPPDDDDRRRCIDCQLSASVVCQSGLFFNGHSVLCSRLGRECFDCLGPFFEIPIFGGVF